MKKLLYTFLLLSIFLTFGQTGEANMQNSTNTVFNKGVLHFNYTPEQLPQIEKQARLELEKTFDDILAIPADKRTFENTVSAYQFAFINYGTQLTVPGFLGSVSTNKKLRDASLALDQEVSKYMVDTITRKDLYQAIKTFNDAHKLSGTNLGVEEEKLLKEMMIGFRHSGLMLSDDQLEEFRKLNKKLSELSIKFSQNIRENKDTLVVEKYELNGMPEDFINRLERTKDGRYIITMNYPDYKPFMQNAKNETAREKLEFKFNTRGGEENVSLLEQSITLRDTVAKMLGYRNHAESRLEDRMAKNPRTVDLFLTDLEKKLKPKAKSEKKELIDLRNTTTNIKNNNFPAWDLGYWINQYKKTYHKIDEEKIKEYFPMQHVIDNMLAIFSEVFGINFTPLEIPSWNKDVRTFAIIDAKTKKVLAYFYMDLFPRDGKYKHAACFGLIDGYKKQDGQYQQPFVAIVANFNPPTKDNPSLLLHDEVVTLFHEFGHVLHNALTTAEFSALSGTATSRDFVEVPSQILENWAWDKDLLKKISSHYQTGKPLPDSMITKMHDAKNSDAGTFWTRQNFFAQLDMKYHTSSKIDTTKTYAKMMQDIRMVQMTKGTMPQASFGHLMGGYDAGYYGYLWALVIADDMFAKFKEEGIMNPELGMKLRNEILAVGGIYDEDIIVEKFLGRPVDNSAFFENIGIPVKKKRSTKTSKTRYEKKI
mgnify:FL=1